MYLVLDKDALEKYEWRLQWYITVHVSFKDQYHLRRTGESEVIWEQVFTTLHLFRRYNISVKKI